MAAGSLSAAEATTGTEFMQPYGRVLATLTRILLRSLQVHEKQHRVLQPDGQPLQPRRQPAPARALQAPRQPRRHIVDLQERFDFQSYRKVV